MVKHWSNWLPVLFCPVLIMKYLFLIIFAVSTGIHLYASLKQDRHLRNLTKPFLIPALAGFYIVCANPVRSTILLALLFSWLGDLFLMKKGQKWFAAGGICFMIAHMFFILCYLRDIDSEVFRVFTVFPAVLFLLAAAAVLFYLKQHLPENLFYPMSFYLCLNAVMNCFAVLRYISHPDHSGMITMIGALLFFISDSCLFVVRFKKKSRLKTHFLVMLTYSLGEFLIVFGLILH